MKLGYKVLIAFALISFSAPSFELFSQTGVPQNLSTVKVDQLSDDQLRSFISQIGSTAMSESQLEQLALSRGMSSEEIIKLKSRLSSLNAKGSPKGSLTQSNIGRVVVSPTETKELNESSNTSSSKVFGADLFNNKNLSFEPNLRIATPANYVFGPDDEVRIDISGYSDASFKLTVSPEGYIRVDNVGLIQVSGLTVEQAKARIISRLIKYYPAIASGATQVNIGLGNIRSIKVTVLGEAQKPGSYSLPSLATAFNALYVAGGPAKNGSLRRIEIIRNNKTVRVLDVYDFLMRGDQQNNIRLQDQDIIRIPPYINRVEFSGEVKRPAIFETLPGENLAQLIDFAGGFTESAYTSRIKVLQNTDKERRITDVFSADFKTYQPKLGDRFYVEPILDRFENRVFIEGAVFRPGEYALSPGLTLTQLLKSAEGLTEDAFTGRAYLTRLKADNSFELIAFDLAKITKGEVPDISLKREDKIQIASIFDLRDEYKVNIDGAVRQPGEFKYAENTSLEDLIIQAGGFSESGTAKRVEVARRVKGSDVTKVSVQTAEVFQIDVDPKLNFSTQQFKLQPFDIVSVRNAPGFEEQRQVYVRGEVTYPGAYALSKNDERISEIIQRAGGLTAIAYPKGASLKRPGPPLKKSSNKELAKETAEDDKQKFKQLTRLQKSVKDTTGLAMEEEIEPSIAVGIRLERILNNPGSNLDLILEAGDTLTVPKQLQTVKVSGEVLSPITMVHRSSTGLRQYIAQAGGLTDRAMLKRAYVIYANGGVKGTRRALFFNFYPKVTPGAEIFVPKRPERNKLSPQELLGITSGIASLGAVILGIINLTN